MVVIVIVRVGVGLRIDRCMGFGRTPTEGLHAFDRTMHRNRFNDRQLLHLGGTSMLIYRQTRRGSFVLVVPLIVVKRAEGRRSCSSSV